MKKCICPKGYRIDNLKGIAFRISLKKEVYRIKRLKKNRYKIAIQDLNL